jgi:hypothetical protein
VMLRHQLVVQRRLRRAEQADLQFNVLISHAVRIPRTGRSVHSAT